MGNKEAAEDADGVDRDESSHTEVLENEGEEDEEANTVESTQSLGATAVDSISGVDESQCELTSPIPSIMISEDGAGDPEACNPHPFDSFDCLPPLQRLEKYALTRLCKRDRNFVGRMFLETLKSVADSHHDVAIVLWILHNMSESQDPVFRTELMDHIPHIAMLCHSEEKLHYVVDHLLPFVAKQLTDCDAQVRKAAQVTLLVLMDQRLVRPSAVENVVCPVVTLLSGQNQYAGNAVQLMSKMAPFLGVHATERLFLARFCDICYDSDIHVRKMCAASFAEFCAVVGQQTTDDILLHRFYDLCQDTAEGVRKACADVFMSVSCACTMESRKSILAPVFVRLLWDSSRWVRSSAFKTLGPFISTFAVPKVADIVYNVNGELVFVNRKGCEFRLNPITDRGDIDIEEDSLVSQGQRIDVAAYQDYRPRRRMRTVSGNAEALKVKRHLLLFKNKGKDDSCEDPPEDLTCGTSSATSTAPSEEWNFNSFQYWRLPIPEISNLDELAETELTNLSVNSPSGAVATECDTNVPVTGGNLPDADSSDAEEVNKINMKNFQYDANELSFSDSEYAANDISISDSESGANESSGAFRQDIVPPDLVELFVSMPNPPNAHMTDVDIALHCAFSLPAVALTLGRENWGFLKSTYEALAADMQWKVRRTVACSIHELAEILGEEITVKDLVPIFTGLIRDLDEVRIGALKHLADFVKLLPSSERRSFLHQFELFLVTDNEWNWRFREQIAFQLLRIIPLYTPEETCDYIVPVAMVLLRDRVAAVRTSALFLVTHLINHVACESLLLRKLLPQLAQEFANSTRWERRQAFVLLCSKLVSMRVLGCGQFARDVLPYLLDLSYDRVPNVRLAVAKTISSDILAHHFFSAQSPHQEVLMQVLKRLINDKDRDVRFFAEGRSGSPSQLLSSPNQTPPSPIY